MTRASGWLLATSLRGLASRTVLSLGSLLLTVIAIASAVVGPSYQLNAANSFVIAQLGAQPLINTGLTYDYQHADQETADDAIVTALDETSRESGTGYNPGHAMVWDELAETRFPASSIPAIARLVSVPGACTHVALVGTVSHLAGRDRGAEGRRRRPTAGSSAPGSASPSTTTPYTVVGIYTPKAQDEGFWFGPRLQTAPGRLLPTADPVAAPHPGSPPRPGSSSAATAGSSPSTSPCASRPSSRPRTRRSPPPG